MSKFECKFTAIPNDWMRRTDINPPLKLILGRIFTLSNIDDADPEVSASGLAEQTGLSWSSGDRAVKMLEKAGVLKFKERRREGGEWPYRVFTINRQKLLAYMEPPASPIRRGASSGSGCQRHLEEDAASSGGGLKEYIKEDNAKNTEKNGHPPVEAAAKQQEPDLVGLPMADEAVRPEKRVSRLSPEYWRRVAAEQLNILERNGEPFAMVTASERKETVSGPAPEPLEKPPQSISGGPAQTTPDNGPLKNAERSGDDLQRSLTVPEPDEKALRWEKTLQNARLYTKWLAGGKKGPWPPPDLAD